MDRAVGVAVLMDIHAPLGTVAGTGHGWQCEDRQTILPDAGFGNPRLDVGAIEKVPYSA